MSEDIRNEMTAPRGRHPLFWLDLLLPLVLLAITTPLFHIYNWDMRLQGYFYHPSDGWVTGEQGFFQFLYKFGNIPALLLTLTALYVLIRGFSSIAMSRWRKAAIYLVAVLIIGPGLIVNTLLKDQWGRPRPREVTEFGGKYAYEAPLEIDPDSPGKSFPCGHATMGFFFFAPAFLLRRKHPHASLLLALSAAGLGILIGVARMTQGGHFASDVIWAGALIWLTAAGLYYLLKLDLRLWSQVNKRNPKKLKPFFLSSLLIFIERSDSGGISVSFSHRLTIGVPSTKSHIQEANEPFFALSSRKALALRIAAVIFCRFLMIPSSPIRREKSSSP